MGKQSLAQILGDNRRLEVDPRGVLSAVEGTDFDSLLGQMISRQQPQTQFPIPEPPAAILEPILRGDPNAPVDPAPPGLQMPLNTPPPTPQQIVAEAIQAQESPQPQPQGTRTVQELIAERRARGRPAQSQRTPEELAALLSSLGSAFSGDPNLALSAVIPADAQLALARQAQQGDQANFANRLALAQLQRRLEDDDFNREIKREQLEADRIEAQARRADAQERLRQYQEGLDLRERTFRLDQQNSEIANQVALGRLNLAEAEYATDLAQAQQRDPKNLRRSIGIINGQPMFFWQDKTDPAYTYAFAPDGSQIFLNASQEIEPIAGQTGNDGIVIGGQRISLDGDEIGSGARPVPALQGESKGQLQNTSSELDKYLQLVE